MIAVDTNLLVYAHRADSPFHAASNEFLNGLAEGKDPWTIPWAVAHEFVAIATHPRIYAPPSPLAQACGQLAAWFASPSFAHVTEREWYFGVLESLLVRCAVVGPKVHDARIVAVCLANGVEALYSADRDLSRFANELEIRNPIKG